MIDTKTFCTRSEIVQADNGQVRNAYLVALDIGYSSVKLFSPTNYAMFPSYAKATVEKQTIGQLPDDYILYKDLETGEMWLVGRMAQDDITVNGVIESDEALYGRNRYYDPMFRVITETALGIGLMGRKPEDGRKIVVQTGLPPRCSEQEDKDGLREVIAGRHHFSVKLGSRKAMVFDFTIDWNDVMIMWQPMGTMFSVMIDKNGNEIQGAGTFARERTLVFDPGFGTFDICEISGNTVNNPQTFFNLGMRQVLSDTCDKIREKYGVSVTVPAMQKYLETGTVTKYDRRSFKAVKYEFADLLEESCRAVCAKALEKTDQIYNLGECQNLIITGGTGEAWKDIIHDTLQIPDLVIIDGNANAPELPFVYSNVRGYYRVRFRELWKRGGAI